MSVNGQMLALVRNLLPGLKELVQQNMYCNYMILYDHMAPNLFRWQYYTGTLIHPFFFSFLKYP
jgi:hypothetical protein